MKYIFKVLCSAIVMAIGSQFSYNTTFNDVQIPITAQTLVVLLLAYLLAVKEAVGAVTLYIILGVIGLPVFADGGSGLETLLGNSGGFIVGFIFGSYIASSWASTRTNTWMNAFIAMMLGTIIIIIFGVLRLSFSFGFEKALQYGFYPFWIGALIKIFVGAILGKIIRDRWIISMTKF